MAIGFVSSGNVHAQTAQSVAPAPALPIYDPYPPGVLPTDIASEIQRVRLEENAIEREAINEWHALAPPIVTGNPPIQQNTGTAAIETLGKLMNFDENIRSKRILPAVSVTCRTPDIAGRFRRSIFRCLRTPDPFPIFPPRGRRICTRPAPFPAPFCTTPPTPPSLSPPPAIPFHAVPRL